VLEASFIVVRLQPYFENFGKRMIKSPKLYFTDVGLVSYLLDITDTTQISRDPLRGNIFENLVMMEFIKNYLNKGIEKSIYFYRDSNNNEVDLIIKQGNDLIPIEIKISQTFNDMFLGGLKYLDLLTNRCPKDMLSTLARKSKN
jgi:predicted AAA+ superfamily ATPase